LQLTCRVCIYEWGEEHEKIKMGELENRHDRVVHEGDLRKVGILTYNIV
jgi:hypothetical protein